MISIILIFFSYSLFSEETCSRVAVINYQEVLVDTNTTQKGEGLRYFLEKDEVAKNYLDLYQEGTDMRWQNAAMGTLGTGMIIGGIFTNSSSSNRQSLFLGGAVVMLVNFLVAKTLDQANEKNLIQAIDEYNKRNLPRIYFDPTEKNFNPDEIHQGSQAMILQKDWGF